MSCCSRKNVSPEPETARDRSERRQSRAPGAASQAQANDDRASQAGGDQASQATAPPYQTIGDQNSPNICYGPQPWRDIIKKVWSGPESVVIHTVLLPEGLKPTDPRLREGRVVEETRYELPAGELPDLTLHPADNFAVAVDNDCMPSQIAERGVPTQFEVRDADAMVDSGGEQRRQSAAVNISSFMMPR